MYKVCVCGVWGGGGKDEHGVPKMDVKGSGCVFGGPEMDVKDLRWVWRS